MSVFFERSTKMPSSAFGALLPMFLYEMDQEFAGFLRFVEARGVTMNKRFPLLLGASRSPSSDELAAARDAFAHEARSRIFLLVARRQQQQQQPGGQLRCMHGFRVEAATRLVEERDGVRVRRAWEEFCAARRTDSCCEHDQHVLDLPVNQTGAVWTEAYESMRRLVTVPVWSTVALYEAVSSPSSSSRLWFSDAHANRCWGSSVEGRLLLRSCTNVVGGRVELPERVHAPELFLHSAPPRHGQHPPMAPVLPTALRCGACMAAPGDLSPHCAACAAGEALRLSLVQCPVMEQGWYARVLCAAVTHSAKDHLEKSVVVQQLADGRMFRFAEGSEGNLPMRRSDRLGLGSRAVGGDEDDGAYDQQQEDVQERSEEVMDAMCSDVDAVMHCYMRLRQQQI